MCQGTSSILHSCGGRVVMLEAAHQWLPSASSLICRQFLSWLKLMAIHTSGHELRVVSFPTPTLTSCWSLLPGVSPYILCSSRGAGLLLSKQKSAARAKSRLDFVPPSVVSSHHHYHKTGCQHVAQPMRSSEICSGSDSSGRNPTLVPAPAIRTEGQWWHSGCLTPCSCAPAKDILVPWL